MSGRIILGVDPGLHGALAFLCQPRHGAVTVECLDMPTLLLGKRQVLDEHALARMIDARSRDIDFALVEHQQSQPNNGHVQAFKTGLGYGLLRMALAANFIPYRVVTPQAWKRFMALKGDKDASRAMASQLLPRDAHQWALKKHEGRAEAALIALYAVSHPIVAEAA